MLITQVDNAKTEYDEVYLSMYSEEELAAALQKYLKNGTMPPQEMRSELITYTQSLMVEAITKEEYDYAASLDNAMSQFSSSIVVDRKSSNNEEEDKSLKARIEQTNQRGKEIAEKWAGIITSFKETENQKLDDLSKAHESEKMQFQSRWQQPESLVQFTKPSPALLQLKRQQKAFAIARKFDQAKQLKRMAEQMQKAESQRAIKRANAVMEKQYSILVEKQEKEFKCAVDLSQRKLRELEVQRDREMAANDNLKKQLTTRLNEPKMIKKSNVLPSLDPVLERNVYTSNARHKMAIYRKSLDKARLEIKATEIKTIVKPKTPKRKGKVSYL